MTNLLNVFPCITIYERCGGETMTVNNSNRFCTYSRKHCDLLDHHDIDSKFEGLDHHDTDSNLISLDHKKFHH